MNIEKKYNKLKKSYEEDMKRLVEKCLKKVELNEDYSMVKPCILSSYINTNVSFSKNGVNMGSIYEYITKEK